VIQSAEDQAPAKVFQEYPVRELPREHVSFLLLEPNYDVSRDIDYFRQLHHLGRRLIKKKGVASLGQLLQGFSQNQRQLFWQSYGWFFASQAIVRLGQRGQEQWPFSKGCMIGASEAHVGPDGNISVCHKAQVGRAFVIGNVNRGSWDFENIDRLSTWLHGFDKCSSCFGQRFCDLCFEKLYGEEELLQASRERFCQYNRHFLRIVFQTMLEVMDNNPRLWDGVADYINQRVARERIKQQERLEGLESDSSSSSRSRSSDEFVVYLP
jgi:radical SAM protein with 4Fe4S-binding SPASM domain